MNERQDMSGVWYGRWTATSRHVRPNRFIAVVTEAGGRLSGAISEPDLAGAGAVVHAALDGRRAGSQVRFVKQYDGSGGLGHAVDYAGRINGEGTQVAGEWHLSGYSGGFTMERETFTADALGEDMQADVPEPVA